MPDFLFTADSPTGKRKTQTILAANSQAAQTELESRGWTSIVLHTDDAGAIASSAVAKMYPELTEKITPSHRLESRGLSDFQFFLFVTKNFYIKAPWFAVALIILLVMNIAFGFHNSIIYIGAALGLSMPLIFAACITLFGTARKFNRLVEAYAWGRWQEVLDRIISLRGKVPESELSIRQACALAGMGKLDEARTEWSKFENHPELPRWMFLTQLGDIFQTAGLYDESLKCHAEAYDEDKDNPTMKLDYAMALLTAERDLELAQRLIDEAKQQYLSDLLSMFLPYIDGLVALNSRKYDLAVELFESARKNILPLAAGEPLTALMVDTIQAYMAIALAKSGQTQRAMEEARAPRVRLQARNSVRLLKQLNDAVGVG